MTYRQTLDYLYNRLPMFHRVGAKAYKPNLDNTIALCAILGNPQQKFSSIHVAGTNGKGSTSHMLAAILQQAGYNTGLYTSPHLKDFRERIRINGKKIPPKYVVEFVRQHGQFFQEIKPSFFEMTVAMAFDYFAKEKIDIAVIETGLGGRLDSTNVITPVLSTITNIGLDHMDLLGDTKEKIAVEKAGIIKPGVPVVIGEYSDETATVFLNKAGQCKSKIAFASRNIEVEGALLQSRNLLLDVKVLSAEVDAVWGGSYKLDLTGFYQVKNIKTVLQSVHILRKAGWNITPSDVRAALSKVKRLTGLMGRWQVLSRNPLTICDTGHNEDGIRQVMSQIELTPHEKLHIVFGMVGDKDIESILQLLPNEAQYYFCKADIPRALDEHELAKKASRYRLRGRTYSTVKKALIAAQNKAGKNDLVFVGGSTFVVAEVL